MAIYERRRTRQSFELTLRRIASSIDQQPTRKVSWTDPIFHEKELSVLSIKSLWVAGSFARGSMECGDLDLIVDVVAEKGTLPMSATIRNLFLKRAADVSLYTGNPASNSSGVAFPEAKLIWSERARHYHEAISNIQINPNASRYVRSTDILPFRVQQLAVHDPKELEELIELRDKHIINWSFVPLDSISVARGMWSENASHFADRLTMLGGLKTQKIMEYVIHYLHGDPVSKWRFSSDGRTSFKFGGAEIRVGIPQVEVDLLKNMTCSRLIIAPHITKRGPNGLWLITRADKHPLEFQFKDIKAYYLRNNGHPFVVHENGDLHEAHSLELFHDYGTATEFATEYELEPDTYEVSLAEGSELLRIISLIDMVNIDGENSLPITIKGRLLYEDVFSETAPVVAPEDLIKAVSSAGPE